MLGFSFVVLFSPTAPALPEFSYSDKAIHAVLFASLAASTRARFRTGLLCVLAYAPVSEVLQAVLPINRDGNVSDAVADVLGASIGWWALGRALRRGVARTDEEPARP